MDLAEDVDEEGGEVVDEAEDRKMLETKIGYQLPNWVDL